MFEDGDFKVVDECIGDDEAQENPAKAAQEDSEKSKDKVKIDEPSTPTIKPAPLHGILKNPKTTSTPTVTKLEPSKENNGGSIDFTADVSMEMEKEQAVEDDDGVIQIDVTDPIILEGEDCDPKSNAAITGASVKGVDGKAADVVEVEEVKVPEEPMPDWYKEKLNAKMEMAKERMSKLARVLEYSYPTYKPWLEHFKDPVCHLDPPRRCSLARPHSNRWKFICSRKPVQESTNKEEVSAEGTVNKKVETVWRLGPTDGSGVNTDNASQYPPFVMRVVKVFEEFIQKIELEGGSEPTEPIKEENDVPEVKTADEESPSAKTDDAAAAAAAPVENVIDDKASNKEQIADEAATEEIPGDDVASLEDKPETEDNKDDANPDKERNHNWLWLLVRSNSKDELMVFATGKKISQSTMEKLKETFETGPGKDCNVKSLYCKSISKLDSKTKTNITFLAGSEALDETVGGLKVQLAPKTNFWCNAAGVEELGAAVGDLLNPVQKFTLAEVGCGLGLIGLMQAPKCRQILGLDAPSEVEEAEMTCELNKIENAKFVMGPPEEMMAKMTKLLSNTRSAAIVNANTKIGRMIEMMTALRKIQSLRRVVMITTLTKQSVRAILELTRPMDGDLGNPFMPVRAVLVDTLPVGPHFEVVIRMERLIMQKIDEPWFWNHVQFRSGLAYQTPTQKKTVEGPNSQWKAHSRSGKRSMDPSAWANRRANYRANRRNKVKLLAQLKAAGQGVVVGSRLVVEPGLVTGVVKNPSANLVKNPMANKSGQSKTNERNNASSTGKRSHSPDKANSGSRKVARNNKSRDKSGQPVKSTTTVPPKSQQSNKSARSNNKPKSTSPLKKNPMARVQSRNTNNVASQQRRRRNWGPNEGPSTMRGQPQMASKRQRENSNHNDDMRMRMPDSRMDPVLMRQVQEQQMLLSLAQQKLNTQGPVVDVNTAKQLQNMLNIVLEQTNKLQNQLPRSVWDRMAPMDNSEFVSPSQDNRERYFQDGRPQDMMMNVQDREFGQPMQQSGPVPLFPGNRVPLEPHQVAPAGMGPMEFMRARGMPERPHGGPPRDFRKPSASQVQEEAWRRQNQMEHESKNRSQPQPLNKLPLMPVTTEPMRAMSPKRAMLSPPRTNVPSSRRFNSPSFLQQPVQELRRPHSPPPRRLMSPPRRLLSPARNQSTEIFHRRPATSGRQQTDSIGIRQQRESVTARRSNEPYEKFGDDWNMGNRNVGGGDDNWQSRYGQQQQQQQLEQLNQNQQRSDDRNRSSNNQNWNDSTTNDRYRKNTSNEGTWMTGSGNAWNAKNSSMKSGDQQRSSNSSTMNKQQQWGAGGAQGLGVGGENWNSSRGKDAFGASGGNRMDNWNRNADKKGDKQDCGGLAEQGRDQWFDDGGSSMNKQRQWGGASGSGDRSAGNQNWSNKSGGGGNWSGKGSSMGGNNQPQWPGMGNSNADEERWPSQNVGQQKSLMSGNWSQGGSNNAMNNWRPQGYMPGYSSQRSNAFGSNNYKDGR